MKNDKIVTEYTASQLADELGYHRSSISKVRANYKDKGGIPGARKIGSVWLYTKESLDFIRGLKPGRKLGSKGKPKKLIKGE